MLSTYFEANLNVKGASGKGEQRRLQFPRSNLDPPAPSVADEAPAPVDSPLGSPRTCTCTCRRGRDFAAGRGRGPQGQEKEIVNQGVLDEQSAALC